MTDQNRNIQRRASIIAALVTFGTAIVILVLLFVLNIGDSRRILAEASMPEIEDDEEIFLEPEFLEPEKIIDDNLGLEDNSEVEEEAAPQPPGIPEQASEEVNKRVVHNEKEPPEPPVANKPELVATKKPTPSPVTTSTPKLSKEEEKRLAGMTGNFKSDNNGSLTGKNSPNSSSSSGAGTSEIRSTGNVSGRKMLSCSTWKVSLTQRYEVKVDILVDENGKVTSATAVSGGTPNLRAQCEKMAKTSKWTPKSGAAPARGSITFTLSP